MNVLNIKDIQNAVSPEPDEQEEDEEETQGPGLSQAEIFGRLQLGGFIDPGDGGEPPEFIEDGDEEDEDFVPGSPRVRLRVDGTVVLAVWQIALYEAACASGYRKSLTDFNEEVWAIFTVITGADVRIMPMPQSERDEIILKLGYVLAGAA